MLTIYRAGKMAQVTARWQGKVDDIVHIHTVEATAIELSRIYTNAPFLRSQFPNTNKDGDIVFYDEEAKAAVMAFNYNER